jgi:hypothetical protein
MLLPMGERKRPDLEGNVMVADGASSSKGIMELWAHLAFLAFFFSAALK